MAAPPRLSRADFLRYITAFNARDYAVARTFYHPTVTMILPRTPPLHGPEAIFKYYGQTDSLTDEVIVPITLVCEADKVFLVLEAWFRYTADTAEGDGEGLHAQRVRSGDVYMVEVWALYDVDEAGLMTEVRTTLAEERMLGQVQFEPLVEDARSRAQADLR